MLIPSILVAVLVNGHTRLEPTAPNDLSASRDPAAIVQPFTDSQYLTPDDVVTINGFRYLVDTIDHGGMIATS